MTVRPPRRVVAVVLAAGLGTRMRSRLPKVLHPICGRPMLGYVLDAARAATDAPPLVVVSPQTARVREAYGEEADFALQAAPRGTADAVAAALTVLPPDVEEIVVLSGDVPLVDAALVGDLVMARRETGAAVALVSVDADDPGGLGRVVRDDRGRVQRVVEVSDASPGEREIEEVNAGLYAFDVAWLRRRLPGIAPSAVTGELYLPLLVEMARADDLPVAALEVDDDGTLLGINDRSQLADAELEMRLRINERHMLAGVTMLDPTTALVDATVELAEDVTLEPDVILRGATRVGRDSRIRAGSQLFDTVVGEGCVIWASVVEASTIEDGASLGPFCHVRAGSLIGTDVQLGNFAEVKASRLGRGTKSHHFSYIGDAEVGERVNIGAGTITANYDGRRKHHTRIGDGAFIGSDTILRAPVEVGEGAYTGAGSVVTRDVPPGMLAVGLPARLRHRRDPAEPEAGTPAAAQRTRPDAVSARGEALREPDDSPAADGQAEDPGPAR